MKRLPRSSPSRRYARVWTSADGNAAQAAEQIVSEGLRDLERAVVRKPPTGTTPQEIAVLFQQHRPRLAELLGALVAKALAPREPRCSICRKPRGSNAECGRCQAFERMRREPTSKAALDAAMVVHRQREAASNAIDEQRLEKLRGRTVRVCLVGCGKLKASEARPAKDLYLGQLFRAARAYAEQSCDDWVVLSALHGVVPPDQVLEPYDLTMGNLRIAERETWAHIARGQLRHRYRGLDVQFIGLAAEDYLEPLEVGRSIVRPLEGMGIGTRIKYLRDAVGCQPCRGGAP